MLLYMPSCYTHASSAGDMAKYSLKVPIELWLLCQDNLQIKRKLPKYSFYTKLVADAVVDPVFFCHTRPRHYIKLTF